jgi:predicted nucleotidyltransferase
MLTSKALNIIIESFLTKLEQHGYSVERAVLFGSYATGKPHKYSDIDLAIWLSDNLIKHYTEIPELLHIVSSHHPVQPKFYAADETSETDPFIGIIEKTGKEILLPVKI